LAAAADFRQHRMDLQHEQLERLAERLPLPRISLPFLVTTEIGTEELDRLAQAVLDAFEGLSVDEVLDEDALAGVTSADSSPDDGTSEAAS
jgi:hypothetical protein